MTFLLDVNVLIALIDPGHISHDLAHHWFASLGRHSWATCAVTENGVIRIVGHPKYPGTPGTPAVVADIVTRIRTLPNHVFWHGTISLCGTDSVDTAAILTPAQVTDTYLLALAVAHRGQLATLDRRLSTRAVKGGAAALHVIDGKLS